MKTYTYSYGGPAPSSLSNDDMAIIQHITTEFVNRLRQNIADWRMALEAADHPTNPRWQPLMDLYEYLRPDGHLGSQMDIRKGTVTSNRFFVRDGKTGKENKDKTKLLRKKWFKNFVKDLLDNIFFGHTNLQIRELAPTTDKRGNKSYNLKYDLLPRRNFIYQFDLWLFATWGSTGVVITDPVFNGSVISIKNQYKFGILNDIVPDLIWKRNARQAWAEFSNKFGIPMLTATTTKTDKKSLDLIEAQLKALGQAARAVLPEGTVMKIDESGTKGDPYKTFLEQIHYCDAIISKRVVGGTMISDDGSSRSQSEVHERTRDWIIGEDDRSDIEFTVNDQLMPLLIDAGIGFDNGDEFVYDRSEDLSTTQHWAIVKDALTIYDIDDEWVAETFQIPIKGRKAQQPTKPSGDPAPADDPQPDPAPEPKKKQNARASFFA